MLCLPHLRSTRDGVGALEGCEWPGAWLVRHVIGLKKGQRVGWEVYQCQAPLLEGPEWRVERRRAGLGFWIYLESRKMGLMNPLQGGNTGSEVESGLVDKGGKLPD